MLGTNLKILAVVLGTLAAYTALANMIPQVQSEVPEELTLGAEATGEELAAAGEILYFGAGGCTACHGLGTRAPHLLEGESGVGMIGERCGDRVAGMSCKEYLYQSMVDPNAVVVGGFGPIMPDVSRTLSAAQIWALIAYLQSQGGQITVTGADLAAAEGAGGPADPAATAAGAGGTASLDPMTILRENQCLACHQLAGEGGPIGPPLDGIGARLDAEALRRSILQPNAEIAEGYEAFAGTMPATFGQQLTAGQLEALVEFLGGLR